MYPATTGAKQRMIITENYHYRCDHLPRWHLAGRRSFVLLTFAISDAVERVHTDDECWQR